MKKHERELHKLAARFGGRVERGKKHFRIVGDGWVYHTSATPSDRRAMHNAEAHIRKMANRPFVGSTCK